MRIIHLTHPNGEEVIILTDRPLQDTPHEILADILGPIGPFNTVTDYDLSEFLLDTWPPLLPTERPLST